MAVSAKRKTVVERMTDESPLRANRAISNLADLFNRRVESPSIRRILLAAVDSFAKTGFHASSTREIAKKAKLSPAAVYVHFRSKEELLYTVVLIISEWVLDQMVTASGGTAKAPERLRRMVHVHVSCHAIMRTAVYVANYEFSSLNTPQRNRILKIRDAIEDMFANVLEDGVKEGSFKVPNIAMTKVAIVSLCVSVLNWFSPRGRLGATEVGALYADMVLAMVRTK